jgi:hypothetical protein
MHSRFVQQGESSLRVRQEDGRRLELTTTVLILSLTQVRKTTLNDVLLHQFRKKKWCTFRLAVSLLPTK